MICLPDTSALYACLICLAARLLEFNQAPDIDAEAFARDVARTSARWIAPASVVVQQRAPGGGPVMLGYVRTDTHAHTHTHRHTLTHADTHRHSQTHRHRHRHRH